MIDQPRLEPYEASSSFADGRAMRPLVEGTVARGRLAQDESLVTGRAAGKLVAVPPLPVDAALVRRGRERFEIFCAVCHGLAGHGDGMIVRRGFRQPPTYHSNRLRQLPIGHIFDVATNGFGAMPSYASQVPVRDRWAIAVYVRALQLSQFAPLDALPADEQQRLRESLP
jgi:mono/diheme cytochrome c family protein